MVLEGLERLASFLFLPAWEEEIESPASCLQCFARLAAKDSRGPQAPATLRQEAQLAAALDDLLKEN